MYHVSNVERNQILSWSQEELFEAVFDYKVSRRLLQLSRTLPEGAESWSQVDALMENPDGTSRFWKLLLIRASDLWELVPRSESGSIQRAVISALTEQGDCDVESDYRKQRQASWELVVNQAQREMLSSNDLERIKGDREVLELAGRIARYPHEPVWKSKIAEAIDSENVDLLKEITRHVEGTRKGGSDEKKIWAGILWTAPDYPLWLMSNFVRSQIAMRFSLHARYGDPFASGNAAEQHQRSFEHHFDVAIGRSDLKPRRARVIRGIKEFQRDGKREFAGYEFDGIVDSAVAGTSSWCPPGYITDPTSKHRCLHEYSSDYPKLE